LDNLYQILCETKSDINEHLPTLRKYASMCNHVTEFGVRTGVSTSAFLSAQPKTLLSYDVDIKKFDYKKYKALEGTTRFILTQANTLQINIQPTELLFIDTLHTYKQLSQELKKHSNSVSKYIICHDTVTFGEQGENRQKPGLMQAIKEFLKDNKEWKTKEVFENNNGLYVMERI